MAVQIILSQKGPLPIELTFYAITNGPVTMEVSGSVWSNEPKHLVGIAVILDNHQLGAAQIYANAASTHLAVVPAYFPLQMELGPHTIYLARLTGESMGDENDLYNVVLHY